MSQATAEIGELIAGRYRVTSILGVGGMGSVFRAEHTSIGRPVAVKLLHRDLADDPTFAKRFEREAFVTGRSAHPNCVNVSDFGKLDDGTLYLVMELVDGDSLAEILESDTRIEWKRALRIVRHVLRGLAHAHAADIVHRDVKPENVIIVRGDSDPDYAKILDFGIAKLIGESKEAENNQLTQFGTTVGTPNYVAPEQALGQAVDGRSDLYSLSVMLYEMITGSPPFYSEDTLKVLSMHVAADVPAFADRAPELDVPAEVEALVRKGLEKTSANRFESAETYIAAIDAIIGSAPVRAQTPFPVAITPGRASSEEPDAAPAESTPVDEPDAAPAESTAVDDPEPTTQEIAARAPVTPTPTVPIAASDASSPVATAPTDLAMSAAVTPAASFPGMTRTATPPPGHVMSLTGIPTVHGNRRSKVMVGAGITLLIVVIIAVAAGGSSDSEKPSAAGLSRIETAPNAVGLMGPPKPSELANKAENLMIQGDPQGVIALLEENSDKIEDDSFAQMQLGHAHFALGHDAQGIDAYKRAITVYEDLRDNDKVRANAGIAANSQNPELQLVGLEFQSLFLKEDSAKTRLAKIATGERDLLIRKRARQMATDLEIIDRVDLVVSYSLDLAQEEDCEIKKQLITKLQALNDRRAIKPIKRARNKRTGGFLGWRARRVNKCLKEEADAALAHLNSLPKPGKKKKKRKKGR